jgi:hypothetical protein
MNPDDLGTMISQDYFSTTVTDGITITTTDDCDTLTSTVTGSTITLDDYNWFENKSIQIGNITLDEDMAKKLQALIKVLEQLDDNNPIKEMFDAQMMLDKIKGT